MYQQICHVCWPNNNGYSRQTTITQSLTEHGAPPRHDIVSFTGSKKGTAVPSPGIHSSTYQESAWIHPQITTMFFLAYEQERIREDIEHICCSNVVSDDKDEGNILKPRHTLRGHLLLFKPCLVRWKITHHHREGEECTRLSVTRNSDYGATPFKCHTYGH